MKRDFYDMARRACKKFGGFYDFEDILDAIERGDMQSFSDGQSMVVTQVQNYPRRKALHVVLVVGTMDGVMALEPRVIEFAKERCAEVMTAFTREGWKAFEGNSGWHTLAGFMVKELD